MSARAYVHTNKNTLLTLLEIQKKEIYLSNIGYALFTQANIEIQKNNMHRYMCIPIRCFMCL